MYLPRITQIPLVLSLSKDCFVLRVQRRKIRTIVGLAAVLRNRQAQDERRRARTLQGLGWLLGLILALPIPAAAQSLDDDLAALDARITRLEDLNQIERVQRTYGYFVDKGQWTLLSELFTEDATLEIGGKGVFVGRHRVLEYMQTAFGADGPDFGVLVPSPAP